MHHHFYTFFILFFLSCIVLCVRVWRLNKYRTLYTSLSLNRPIRFSHGYQRLVVTQRTITSFFANCRFCSRYVAPLVIYKPTHIKGATLIVMGRPTVIRSIKLHNIQALLPTLWSTYISRYLIGIWTEKLHKIVHVISNICFFCDCCSYFSDYQLCFLSFLNENFILEFGTIAADYDSTGCIYFIYTSMYSQRWVLFWVWHNVYIAVLCATVVTDCQGRSAVHTYLSYRMVPCLVTVNDL